ncbi:uncharacterized protein LOC141708345 [Apium graveolens]|uniref:uncharacterized protein LOC141708345 n=1 Tax=Apium graveolens TaxID=4045 RepID=UPI003D78F80C
MDEAKSMAQQAQAQQQQQHLMLQQQQQQQQQMLLLQQQIQQQQQKKQQQAISRFPSNIDAHLRPASSYRTPPPATNTSQSHTPVTNPNPNSNLLSSNPNQQMQQQQQQPNRSAPPPTQELQMAYQDLWRVCHPDHKRPFSSLEDACHRLLPYHVVADYEAEEDDRILDSDTTGQMPSRSQQWDHNIAAKVSEFAATFEKQVFAFNIINRKRSLGEFRSEERLMLEQILLQEERRSLVELRAEMDSRQKAGREAHEANIRMAAMAHAEQARAESQAHAEMMARGPIRPNALGSQGSNIQIGHSMADQEQEVNPEEAINGWGNNAQRDEKEPSEDFLNDEETENGDAGMEEFDLNTR